MLNTGYIGIQGNVSLLEALLQPALKLWDAENARCSRVKATRSAPGQISERRNPVSNPGVDEFADKYSLTS